MKPHVAVLCVIVVSCTLGCSQSRTENDLYEELAEGPDQVKALETVLETPDEYSALILYVGAGVAFKEERLEDSAFLFYAAQLRSRFDEKCFPPTGTGGDSPTLVYAIFSQALGGAINPAIAAEPTTFARAIDRVKEWNPKVPEGYTPGYEFKERLSEEDAIEAAKPNRTQFLARMADFSTLLNDAEFFAAFRVAQAYNLDSDDKRPTKEEHEKATETMKRIERDKGLEGIFSEEWWRDGKGGDH